MEFVQPIKDREDNNKMKSSLAHYGTQRDVFMWILGTNSALRVSDLLTLRKRDIKNYRLNIHAKKTGKRNSFNLYHIQKQIDEYVQYLEDDDYLFTSQRNKDNPKPIGRVQAHRIIQRASESIGLKNISTHSMRKTFAYHFYMDSSNDIGTLMQILQHSSQQETLRYLGLDQEQIDENVSKHFKPL